MKIRWSLVILTPFILQTYAIVSPAMAESAWEAAHHTQHDANRESDKAAHARAKAHVERLEGHTLRAKWDEHHARHEQHKAWQHHEEAKTYRKIAKHQYH